MNKKFEVFGSYRCSLNSGSEISLNRSISANFENLQEELERALNSDYKTELAKLQDEETKKFEKLKNELDEWQQIAEKIMIIKMADEYTNKCEEIKNLKTTDNRWINSKESRYDNFNISNKTYEMHIRIYEDTYYNAGLNTPIRWDVSYWLSLNCKDTETISNIRNKSFSDKDVAYKYVEGRKKYFAKYFKELYQPVPIEYVNRFKCCGKLIEGYKVESN